MADIFATPAHSAPQAIPRIVALDGLRGVAALMVLFHHTLLTLPDFANVEWHVPGAAAHGPIEWLLLRTPLELIWSGQARALLFFVLSGFVLALPWLKHRQATYGRFLLGRLCRIYPPYLIVMALAGLGSLLLGGHPLPNATVYINQLGWTVHPTWAAIPGAAALLDNHASEFLNEAVWTLVWEVRVAFIFPLLMLPIMRWRNAGVIGVLAALALLRHVATLLIGPAAMPHLASVLNDPQETFYFAEFFVLGTAVALNHARITAFFARRHAGLGLGSLVLGCAICWLPWPVQQERMIGLGAAIILIAILGSAPIRAALSHRALIWLGRQSYSLYLIHVPLIMVVVIACGGRVPVSVCAAIVPLAILLGWLFHETIERPSVALAQRLTGYASPNRPVGVADPRRLAAATEAAE